MKSMFNRAGDSPDSSIHSNEETSEALSLEAIQKRIYPCSPTHPYLVAKGIVDHSEDIECSVYTGLAEIDGVQCHNALALHIFDIDGQLVNFQFIVSFDDGTFAEFYVLPDSIDGCFARIGKPADTILIAQDWASGISLHRSTGHAVAVALTLQNIVATCETLAAKYQDKRIIVCGSDDGHAPDSTLHIVVAAAKGIGAHLAFPQFSAPRQGKPSDFNELFRHEGLDAVLRSVNSAADPESDVGPLAVRAEIKRLAALSSLEYEQQRTKSAKRLGVRPNFLDERIKEERTLQHAISKACSSDFGDGKLWDSPVDGAELAAEICQTIERYMVVLPAAAIAMTFWIISAHALSLMQVSPILALLSPVKRCGKTTALRLVELLTPRPITASNITPAALFRTVELMTPTLLIDEADTFIRKSEELNGIINSGHTRSTAYVIRIEEGMPRRFSTRCPKVVAMIGIPPETMLDRSIAIWLRRKRAEEQVESLRSAPPSMFSDLKSKIARWVNDNAAQLAKQRPVNITLCKRPGIPS